MIEEDLPLGQGNGLSFYNEISPADLPDNPEVKEAESSTDLFQFFVLLVKQYTDLEGENVTERARQWITAYNQDLFREDGLPSKKIVVIKDKQDRVVAGGMVIFQADDEGIVALLRSKVVHEKLRKRGLGKIILDARLKLAEEVNAKTAFCWVHVTNYPALRSMFRDGFVMRTDKYHELRKEFYGDLPVWYLEKPIPGPDRNDIVLAFDRDAIEIDNQTGAKYAHDKVKISLENTSLIQSCLDMGYVGHGVFEEDENTNVRQMLYLAKS